MTLEARVKSRLDAEVKIAKAGVDKASTVLSSANTYYTDAQAKLAGAMGKALAGDKHPTQAQMDKALAAHALVGRALKALLRAKVAFVDAVADAERLQDSKELDRRIKAAKKFGGDGEEPLTGREAAKVVLLNAGRPMHYTEITRLALESGTLRLEGKTPEATMSAYLAKAAKKGDTFVRVDPGVFDLAERVKATA